MCGDHPSVTKTELNVRELKHDEKDKGKKERPVMSFGKISPSVSSIRCNYTKSRVESIGYTSLIMSILFEISCKSERVL